MKLYPEYSENIIAYVIHNGAGSWYVTGKEIWFLNQADFSRAFGVDPSKDDIEFTENISFGNGNLLLSEISPYKVTTEELKELISIYPPLTENEDLLELRPSIYINIDKKELINLFPEPSGQFQNFPPEKWVSKYDDFWHLIPENHVYWALNNESVFNESA